MKRFLIVLAILLWATWATSASAYDIHGRIVGDTSAEMGVTMYYVNCSGNEVIAVTEAINGYFTFYDVPDNDRMMMVQPDSFRYSNIGGNGTYVFEPQYIWIPHFSELVFYSLL